MIINTIYLRWVALRPRQSLSNSSANHPEAVLSNAEIAYSNAKIAY